MTLIIGHRAVGVSETRLEDFQQAVDLGLEMIEFDLRMTADRQLLVYHGPPGMEGRNIIRDKSAQQVDLQAGYHLPRLAEVIEICGPRMRFDLEIKEADILATVIEQFSGAKKIGDQGHIVTSFLDSVVAEAREQGLQAGLILGMANIGWRQRLSELFPRGRAQACGANFLLPKQSVYRHSPDRQAFSQAILWGVNQPADLRRAFADQRVAGVITDYPHRAQELAAQLASQGSVSR